MELTMMNRELDSWKVLSRVACFVGLAELHSTLITLFARTATAKLMVRLLRVEGKVVDITL